MKSSEPGSPSDESERHALDVNVPESERARDLPDEVIGALLRAAGGERGVAWLRFDQQGELLAAGGSLAAFGLASLAPGDSIEAHVVWLAGLVHVPREPVVLPALGHDGGHVDVHVTPEADSLDGVAATRGLLIVLDADHTVRERAQILERANEASFLRDRLAGAERGRRGARRERAETLGALGAEILERSADGLFRPQRRPPAWLVAVCEWEPDGEYTLSADDPSSFLGTFLGEVESQLDDGAPTLVRSGMWSQEVDGDEQVFEAVAMVLTTGRRVLVIEHIDQRYQERRELLQRAREASLEHEAVRRGVEHKDVLLHCIVHDLRSPLASITGALRLLRRTDLAAAQREELFDIALRQSERQDELIRAVLEVFRAEVEDLQRFEVDPGSAPDLWKAAEACVRRARPAYLDRGIQLRGPLVEGGLAAATAPGAWAVIGAAERLERVIQNLLDNALRHSPDGGEVEVRLAATSDGPLLTVADRGAGVPDTLRDALFQRFGRGTAGGAAGLGLYYCRMTVERWGGTIVYRDREGGGAQFELGFRAAREVSSAP